MKIFPILLFLSLSYVFISCNDECDNENPSVILINNSIGKADIQIKTTGGNTENVNNIQPGETSEERKFAPGDIEFTVSIQGVQDNIIYILTTQYCTAYTVTIMEDNTIVGDGRKLEKISYP